MMECRLKRREVVVLLRVIRGRHVCFRYGGGLLGGLRLSNYVDRGVGEGAVVVKGKLVVERVVERVVGGRWFGWEG